MTKLSKLTSTSLNKFKQIIRIQVIYSDGCMGSNTMETHAHFRIVSNNICFIYFITRTNGNKRAYGMLDSEYIYTNSLQKKKKINKPTKRKAKLDFNSRETNRTLRAWTATTANGKLFDEATHG